MKLELDRLFEDTFFESRTTDEFKKWWFDAFSTGDFKGKKVSARIDFFPLNSLFDEFEDHFVEVLYDPSEEKLPAFKAQEVALTKLRTALRTHFEDKINVCKDELGNVLSKYDDEGLPENTVNKNEKGKYSINYPNKPTLPGRDNSMSEFVIDVDAETKNGIKGSLIKTYKLKRLVNLNKDWKFNTPDGRVESYSKYSIDLKAEESPYVDGLGIDTSKDSVYTEEISCHFTIKIETEEAPVNKGDEE